MRIIRKFFGLGVKLSLLLLALPFFCFLCFGITLTIVKSALNQDSMQVDPQSIEPDDVAKLVFANNKTLVRQTQGFHADQVIGGSGGGFDYTTFCGDTIFSPVLGSAVVTYKGYDGLYLNNTMITITGQAGTATLLHGNYDRVEVGDTVVGGVTPIGTNASNGKSSGCHAHINWTPSVHYVLTGKNDGYKGDLSGFKIAVSHYVPSMGGTNCDSDCTTMASGDKVIYWTFGRNGIYAAACPPELPFGTRFTLGGKVYECRDRGGYIQVRTAGEYDPAFKSVATENYFWVDLLNENGGYSYGQKTEDWSFVR